MPRWWTGLRRTREMTLGLNNISHMFILWYDRKSNAYVKIRFYLNGLHKTWEQPLCYLLLVRPFTDLAQQSVGQIQVELMRPFFCQRLCETGAGQKLKQRQNQDGTEPRREFGVFGYQTQCCKTDERKVWGDAKIYNQHLCQSEEQWTPTSALGCFHTGLI